MDIGLYKRNDFYRFFRNYKTITPNKEQKIKTDGYAFKVRSRLF